MTPEKCSSERPCEACLSCLEDTLDHFCFLGDSGRQVFNAALARAREEGAREMRERAAKSVVSQLSPGNRIWAASIIYALPITPDGDSE